MQELHHHSVCLEQRKKLTVHGVESVVAFSGVKIILALIGGERMHILGNNLKIIGFSKTNGDFEADGEVSGISYGGKTLTAKLFR